MNVNFLDIVQQNLNDINIVVVNMKMKLYEVLSLKKKTCRKSVGNTYMCHMAMFENIISFLYFLLKKITGNFCFCSNCSNRDVLCSHI